MPTNDTADIKTERTVTCNVAQCFQCLHLKTDSIQTTLMHLRKFLQRREYESGGVRIPSCAWAMIDTSIPQNRAQLDGGEGCSSHTPDKP